MKSLPGPSTQLGACFDRLRKGYGCVALSRRIAAGYASFARLATPFLARSLAHGKLFKQALREKYSDFGLEIFFHILPIDIMRQQRNIINRISEIAQRL